MASDGEISCTNDPNFAVIYSFLKVFGELYSLDVPTITKLQELIENTQEVLDPLKELHVRLLRRALKSVQNNRWERCLIKFCHQQAHHQEAWEIERFSYKKASTQVKLTVLKLLLEYQFTCHPKFKSAVNAISCKELRLSPVGRDKNGCVYWLQVDHEANLCLYKEDQDEETWQLIACNREELVKVINQLKSGEEITASAISNNEDSNSADVPQTTEDDKPIKETAGEEENEEFLSPESESDHESDNQKQQEETEECEEGDTIDLKEEINKAHQEEPKQEDKGTEESINLSENIDNKDKLTNVEASDISGEDSTSKPAGPEKTSSDPDEETKSADQADEETKPADQPDAETEPAEKTEDEFVSEAIEEPVMVVTGEGNGADCESSYFFGEEIEEPVFYVFGDGWGADNDTGNPEAIEKTEHDNKEETPVEECNGQNHNLSNSSNKKVKNVKLRSSVVNKRSLKKQLEDSTETPKSDPKKHCIRDCDKANGSNLNEESDKRDSSVTDKSIKDRKNVHTNKRRKKLRTKVKKKSVLQKNKKEESAINSVSENENCQNSKTSIIEKRKSSLSSENDHCDQENTENDVEKSSDKEQKVEDDLPTKKLKLESLEDSTELVSNSKEVESTEDKKENNDESDEAKNEKSEANDDMEVNSDDQEIAKRKKIKARKGKAKSKKILRKSDESNKDKSVVKKQSRALKRSLLNTTGDKTNESQSESEEEEPVKGGKRLKMKTKKVLTSPRKKVEAKLMAKSSSESEDETLQNLAGRKSKKNLKKKSKKVIKEKAKSKVESEDSDTPVRQSRRIAQMKIKEEAERRHAEEVALREMKMIHNKKSKDDEEEWKASAGSSSEEAPRRARRKWRSDSSPEPDSESDEPLFEHEEPEPINVTKSDHEFSPESDLESGEPAEPLKRVRTLQEADEDGACVRCGSGSQPEWVLLCDSCDAGYHASCLKPVLLLIPEGDWFCPPCSHKMLITALEDELVKYDKLLASVEEERERKKLEAPPERAGEKPNTENTEDKKSDDESGSDSSSWSSSSGGVYRLRARRQLPVSYRSQEYDRLISSAIKEEYVEPTTSAGNQGRGKDISTIIEAAEEEKMKAEREAIEQGMPVEPKKMKKKTKRKPRKLNSLEVPSEDDDETDEDFKDTGMESSSEEISSSAERDSTNDSRSSDSLPIRRTCRPEKKDRQRIIESSPESKKKKKVFEDSSSESAEEKKERKRKSKSKPKRSRHHKSKSKSRSKSSKSRLTQYDAAGNVIRARVTYGGLSDDGPNDWSPKHRTRQKKINYTEMPNTESEDEMHKSSGKHMDSSDEFKADESWESSSGSERRRRRSGSREQRALEDLAQKTAIVPLCKLPEHVTQAKTDELRAHLEAQASQNAEQSNASGTPKPARGRGSRGGRGTRGGRGRGRGAGGEGGTGDDALSKLVGVKIKELKPDDGPLKPNQIEREKKRQEREAKLAEKEAKKLERIQKKEEKEKLKEMKAKEREEKRLAKIALQESKRVKKEKPEFGMSPMGYGVPIRGMGPDRNYNPNQMQRAPGDFPDQRFPTTPRLQVRPELRGIATAEDRLHRPDQPNVLREGTLSVAGSPQPFAPAPEEPSVITRMPHMLQQYRGQMMYSPGNPPYGPPRGQGMQMYQMHHSGHPQNVSRQYPPQYYSHLQSLQGYRPGGPPQSSSPNGPPGQPHGPPGQHGPPGMHGPMSHGQSNLRPPGSLPPGPQALLHRSQGPSPHGPPRPPASSPHVPPASSPHSASPYMRHMGPHGPLPGPPGSAGSMLMRPSGPYSGRPDSQGPHPLHGPPPHGPQVLSPHGPHAPSPHGPHAPSPHGPHAPSPHGPHGPHAPSPHGPHAPSPHGPHAPSPHGPHAPSPHGPHAPSPHGPHAPSPQGPHVPSPHGPHMPPGMLHGVPPPHGPPNMHGPPPSSPLGLPPGPHGAPPRGPSPGAAAGPRAPGPAPPMNLMQSRVPPVPSASSSAGDAIPHRTSPPASDSNATTDLPIKIKAEVKTEQPEYRSPPASPSQQPSPEPLRNHPKIKRTENKDGRLRFPLGPYAPQYGPYGPYAPGAAPPPDALLTLQARLQHPPAHRMPPNVHQYMHPNLGESEGPTPRHPGPERPGLRDILRPQMPPNMRRPPAPEGPTVADMLRPSAPDHPGMRDLQRIHIQDRAMLHGMPRPPGPGAPAHQVPGPHPGAHDMPGPDRPPTRDIPRPRTPERPTMHDAPEPRAQDRPGAYDSPEPPERAPGPEWPRSAGERPRPPSSGPPQDAPKNLDTDAPRPSHETARPADVGHHLMRAPAPERHRAPDLPPHYPYMRPQLRPFGMPILRQPGPMMPHFAQFQEMHRIDRPPPFQAREPAPATATVPDRASTPDDDVPESIRKEAPPSPPDVKPQFLQVPVPVNSASGPKPGPVKAEPPGEAPREGGGVFGGLVSYFSSQREDDIDS